MPIYRKNFGQKPRGAFNGFRENEASKILGELGLSPDILEKIQAFCQVNSIDEGKITKAAQDGNIYAQELADQIARTRGLAFEGVRVMQFIQEMGELEADNENTLMIVRKNEALVKANQKMQDYQNSLVFKLTKAQITKAVPWVFAGIVFVFAGYLVLNQSPKVSSSNGNSVQTVN